MRRCMLAGRALPQFSLTCRPDRGGKFEFSDLTSSKQNGAPYTASGASNQGDLAGEIKSREFVHEKAGQAGEPALPCSPRVLPVELRADLPDARIARVGDHSEQVAAEVAVRRSELRVVEDVEELTAELNRHGFGNRNSLRHPEIGVQDSGTVKKPAVRSAKASEGCGGERAGEKIRVSAIWTRLPRALSPQ